MVVVLVLFDVLVIFDRKDLSLQDIKGIEYHEKQINLYDASGCENFFYDYEGNIVEAQNGSYMSNWIACTAGQKITRNGIATNVVCYFDREKKFIKRVDSYGQATIVVPDDDRIAYVRIAVQPANDRVIVFGSMISDQNINGNYYSIPELKISDRNLINDYTIIKSPNGTLWKIRVNDDGSITTEDVTSVISPVSLPMDFPEYEISGSSISKEDFFIALKDETKSGNNYFFIMSPSGDVKWYKAIPNWVYNFRKIEYSDGTIRYAYADRIAPDSENPANIVLMDENFNVINSNIHPLQYGSINVNDSLIDIHDYKIIDDNHYILMARTKSKVNNIPSENGKDCYVYNTVVQEQKDGQVILQWESIDHPELYNIAIIEDDYSKTSEDRYADYVHINSVVVDPNTFDLLISCRHMGLIKIDRTTGEILWVMGRKRNDIKGMTDEQVGLYQHDARYTEDGSITIFDNSGGKDNNSRVCRYWIDEKNLTLEKCEIFETPYKSSTMGSATLLDDESDTYLICYGSGGEDIVFEERCFSNNSVKMKFKFKDGQKIYRIFTGKETTPVKR
ncbi:MAG: aryl-sulfate sulfotransferase [Lachnospiraceae bacterium]|nr:aryl-sulfate sulfotransferase [Lachnospiraceae bacterium]